MWPLWTMDRLKKFEIRPFLQNFFSDILFWWWLILSFVFKHHAVICVWHCVNPLFRLKNVAIQLILKLDHFTIRPSTITVYGGKEGEGRVFYCPPPPIPTFYPWNLTYKLDLDAKQWIGMCTSLDDSLAIAPALLFNKQYLLLNK